MSSGPNPNTVTKPGVKSSLAKPKKRSSWIVTIPLAAVAAAYLYWSFFPGMKTLAALRKEIQSQQEYIAQAEKLASAVQATERQIREADEFCQTWRDKAPQGKHQSEFLGSLMTLAKSAGTHSNRLTPHQPREFETLIQTPIHLNVDGSYAAVYEMLRRLESLPQAIWVSELKIEANRDGEKKPVAEVGLDVFAGNQEISN